jgi:hypothetical protein
MGNARGGIVRPRESDVARTSRGGPGNAEKPLETADIDVSQYKRVGGL